MKLDELEKKYPNILASTFKFHTGLINDKYWIMSTDSTTFYIGSENIGYYIKTPDGTRWETFKDLESAKNKVLELLGVVDEVFEDDKPSVNFPRKVVPNPTSPEVDEKAQRVMDMLRKLGGE